MTRFRSYSAYLSVLALWFVGATSAYAMCDILPDAEPDFRGRRGLVDRAFAGPGRWIAFSDNPSCNSGLPSFAGDYPDNVPADEFVVSMFFTPPDLNLRHAVFLARDCTKVDTSTTCGNIQPERQICLQDSDLLKIGHAPTVLRARFPAGVCKGSTRPGLPCSSDPDCGGAPGDSCDSSGSLRPLAGPMTLVVTDIDDPLPCKLNKKGKSCQNAAGRSIACVDALYPMDGSCGLGKANDVFPSFTALPPANDFELVCTKSSTTPPCDGDMNSRFQLAVDSEGSALLPINWTGIREEGKARYVLSSTAIPPLQVAGTRIELPSRAFVRSYNERSRPLPALFDLGDPGERLNEFTLWGTTDGSYSVLRIARRMREDGKYKVCQSGPRENEPCHNKKDCGTGNACSFGARCDVAGGAACHEDGGCDPGVTCTKVPFSLAERMQDGVGPVVISRKPAGDGVCDEGGSVLSNDGDRCDGSFTCSGECVDLRAEAGAHFDLDPLHSDTLFVSVVEEEDVEHDLNGNPNDPGPVVLIRDRDSTELLTMGEDVDCPLPTDCDAIPTCSRPAGRAVVKKVANTPPYDVSVTGDTVQLREDCAKQPGGCSADTLRFFTRKECPSGSPKPVILIEGPTQVALPMGLPVVDGAPEQLSATGLFVAVDDCGVLHAVDALAPPDSGPALQVRASAASVAGSMVAFLRPEGAPAPGCGGDQDSGDWNRDGDLNDDVVFLWKGPGTEPVNLGRAATEIALSEQWIAAVLPEVRPRGFGWPLSCSDGGDGNRDGDLDDGILHVLSVAQATSGDSPEWRSLGQEGQAVSVAGDVVTYLRPPEPGSADVRRLQVYFAKNGHMAPTTIAAKNYVLDDAGQRACDGGTRAHHLLAFEGPARRSDATLQILDLTLARDGDIVGAILDTGAEVAECDSLLCGDAPYAFRSGSLRYVTGSSDDGFTGNVLDRCDPALVEPAASARGDALPTPARFHVDESVRGVYRAGLCSQSGALCFERGHCPKREKCRFSASPFYAMERDKKANSLAQ